MKIQEIDQIFMQNVWIFFFLQNNSLWQVILYSKVYGRSDGLKPPSLFNLTTHGFGF